jgi:hypothetical protein
MTFHTTFVAKILPSDSSLERYASFNTIHMNEFYRNVQYQYLTAL